MSTMKKHLLLFITLMIEILTVTFGQAPTTANYAVTNNNGASLLSMTGSESLIPASKSSNSSPVESTVFDFWFMGVRYNNFTVNSNGLMRFGTSVISNTQTANGFPLAAASGAVLAPFAANLNTSSSGKVHSVVIGTAPTRKCIIEFLNMGMGRASSTANGTFQIILNETTGVIQYIYGGMTIANITGVSGTESAVIGFSSDNVNTKTLSLDHSSFGVNTNTPATKNNYTATGNIGSLNSTANGSRREIKFTPVVLAAPSAANTSAYTTNSITIGWNGLSVIGEQGFVIYKSDDGGVTYDFVLQTAADATTAIVPNLLAGTNYLFKVYSVSEGALSASVSTTGTTTACGASTTNTLNLTGSGPFTWSALAASWSLAHLPTSCEDAVINFNGTTASDEQIALNFDVDVAIKSLTVNNISTSANVKVFNISGYGKVAIAGDLTLTCPGGNKFDRCAYSTQNKTTINGNVFLSRPAASHTITEGQAAIGSNGNSREQLYLLRGNMTFNKRGYTTDEHTNFTFDKAGTQYLYNYTIPQPDPYTQGIGDTLQAVLFEKLIVGNANAANLIFAGTSFDGYMELQSREGVLIGVNSTLDLPANYSINSLGGSSYFKMLNGSKLRLGGDKTISPNTVSAGVYGVAGSNFPGSFSPYTFDPNSTVEYYGSNTITQTIFNGVTYANLAATNGSGSGRAIKQTTAGTLSANTSININALADVYLGTSTGLGTSTAPVTSSGPLNILNTGGLYCNANVVSGAGTFAMGNGSYLGMGHVQGISNSGSATGNIQMTGGRTYNSTGNYIYNGLVSQITGAGLPTTVNDLTTDNPLTVTIATNQLVNGVDSLKQGTFDIGSTKITHNGTGTLNSIGGFMKANLGIVEMKGTSGTAQNLSGNWFINSTISSLINANTKGITVAALPADTLLISSALVYGAVTNTAITTNDNLTLLSRDTATASFGTIPSGSSITGKVNIERYLPAKLSWRLLAAPVANATSPTVTAAWREGGASLASNGYGTRITGPATFVGVDEYTQRASMKYYNPIANTYVNVTNTNTSLISNTQGYYVFIRGDRSVAITGAAIPTILRIKGDVVTGTQVVNVPAGKFVTFGNPYPSNINFITAAKANISNTYYAWNPNSAGSYNVGAFENYTFDGTNYLKVPGGTIRNNIQSGEAIFIQSSGAAGTLTINETDKTGGFTTPVSRTPTTQGRTGITKPTLEINMYTKDIDSSTYLADGILMNFNDDYSSAVDNDDVRKILNAGDNIFLKNGNSNLIVERRPTLKISDTIKLNLTNTRINSYRFEFDPSALDNINLEAILKDKFVGSETAVSLLQVTNYNFNITNDASSKRADRFMIVFKQVPPMRFIKITAVREKNSTATVTWYTENENNVHTYTIESSKDGINFTEIGKQTPTANNNGNPYYGYIHTNPVDENNWYRVKATAITGAEQYSEIAKIDAKEKEVPTAITLFPNPVIEGKVHVNFANVLAGKYQLSVNNMDGQIIYSETLQLQTNNLKKTISLGNVAAGNYQLIIKDEKADSKKISFIVK